MKKYYLLLLFVTSWMNGQIVNIPDANFKAKLLSATIENNVATNPANQPMKIDINNDGEIQQSEASSVTGLNLTQAGIVDLTGVQSFTNMKYLNFYGNNIVDATISNMLNLEQLYLSGNSNIILNLSGLTNLEIFHCNGCNLSTLDASIFPNLTELDCAANSLSNNLNINGLVNLTRLLCYQNSMSNIDVSSLTNLEDLNCTNNNFTSLDVSNLVHLKYLTCNNNDIANLNVSGCTNLKAIKTSYNNLTSLDISNLTHLEEFICTNNSINFLNFSGSNSITKFDFNQNQLPTLNLSSLSNLNYVNCNNNQLTSLNVQGLNQVTDLYCTNNLLTSLNLNGLSSLIRIDSNYNSINTLQLDGLSALKQLRCSNNNLTALNLASSNLLTILDCTENSITSLNPGLYPNLTSLSCGNNLLTSLDLSNSLLLTAITIEGNQLTTIDVTPITNLSFFKCSNNLFTTIDVSQNNKLKNFSAFNNILLESIYMKNGISESSFFLSTTNSTPANMPNLMYICADESQISTIQSHLNGINLPNTVVNSYCSFTPGGNYNTITGSMIFDSNNNGCDATDLPQSNIKININDGTNQGATFTNTSGNYNFYTQTGSFNLTPNVENPSWFNFSPTTATIPFLDNNDNVVTQNFCITPNGIHPDLEVVLVPIIPARPGFDAVYKIVYKNKGNQTVNGIVFFDFNYAYMDFISATPAPSSGSFGYYGFNFTDLAPFETRSILATVNINAPTETNGVNIGDVLELSASVTLTSGSTSETQTGDNLFILNQIVVGSYDPNDITCLQGNTLPTAEIGEYLHYNIRFENTGTAPAENIVVKNTIDLTQYNIQSLQIMESSHPVTVRITGNIAEFIFQGIDLDTGGHGNILLKLKSNTTLTNNLVINSADIFFDYNFPIMTNDEQTVFADLSKNDFVKDTSVQIYPNPTNSFINIKADNTINSIQLYDVQGRLLITKTANENVQTLDLSIYSSGIYFLNVSTSVGKQTQKIIKK